MEHEKLTEEMLDVWYECETYKEVIKKWELKRWDKIFGYR